MDTIHCLSVTVFTAFTKHGFSLQNRPLVQFMGCYEKMRAATGFLPAGVRQAK
jgi:hypothetical protein